MSLLEPNLLDPRTPRRLLGASVAGLLLMASAIGLAAYQQAHPEPGLCASGPSYSSQPLPNQLHDDLAAMNPHRCNAMEYSYVDSNGDRQWADFGAAR